MKVLETNKGNFFCQSEDENLVAFFGPNGELLRPASQKEWLWAQSVMSEVENMTFDFSSLIEEVERKKVKKIKEIENFMGQKLAWMLLNNFVVVDVEKIQLRGQMLPDWEASATSTGGCAYSHQEWINAWAVEEFQIVKINSIVINHASESNANGSWSDAIGFNANYLAKKHPKALFFFINQGHNYSTDGSSGMERDAADEYLVFKRPNMKPVWSEWRYMATERLKRFFFGITKMPIEDYEKFHDLILVVGVDDPAIAKASDVTIDSDWGISAASSSDTMWSDSNELEAWAFLPNGKILAIKAVIAVTEEEQEMMADYEPTPYGYDFKYLQRVAPEALFFLLKEEHSFWADKGKSHYSCDWHLLRPMSKKELMVKKINSKNAAPAPTFGDLIKLK